MSSDAPIGVFDSGLGGLTVLRALKKHLPNENFIYLGDTARLPYGSKSPETIYKYVLQNIDYLVRAGVKAVVIACNSASAVWRNHGEKRNVPIFEVIGPGAEAALVASQSFRIGVVGTYATIAQNSYGQILKKMEPRADVFSAPCPLLVPLVEEGWIDDPLTNLVVHRYVQPLFNHHIDTLILGCTHYPALVANFRKTVGPSVQITDSAETIALKVKAAITQAEIPAAKGPSRTQILTTDRTARFNEMCRFLLGSDELPLSEVINLA